MKDSKAAAIFENNDCEEQVGRSEGKGEGELAGQPKAWAAPDTYN